MTSQLNGNLNGLPTIRKFCILLPCTQVSKWSQTKLCQTQGGKCTDATVFALSGIALQNATQIDPPCDSKCRMRRTHVRYKRKHRLFDI